MSEADRQGVVAPGDDVVLAGGRRGRPWALILGAAGGFGAAGARALARCGMNICGVEPADGSDRALTDQVIADVEALGSQPLFARIDVVDPGQRRQLVARLQQRQAVVQVVLHALEPSEPWPFVAREPTRDITPQKLRRTIDVLANSLVYWTQDLVHGGLMAEEGHIFAILSEAVERVWSGYGAVSAAQAALRAHVRQLSVELAPMHISVNAIQVGVTSTFVGGAESAAGARVVEAMARNPFARVTTPADVARVVEVLSGPGLTWLTGDVIRVDGGEALIP